MKIVPFKPEHALAIDLQERQAGMVTGLPYAENLGKGIGWTGLDGDTVVFCCGALPIWERRWLAWALLSKSACRKMLAVSRAVVRLMTKGALPFGHRLEIIVREDFPQGLRWAEILGLHFHHREEWFLPDGADARIYVEFY